MVDLAVTTSNRQVVENAIADLQVDGTRWAVSENSNLDAIVCVLERIGYLRNYIPATERRRAAERNSRCRESVRNPVSSLDLLSKDADCHHDQKGENDSRDNA